MHCCDIICHVLTAGLAAIYIAMCLLGRFPRCLMAVGSMGDILKLTGRFFSWWCHEECSLVVGGISGSVDSACGDVNSQKNDGNYMICPDLFRKVMFSNHSSLTGGNDMGGLFQNNIFLRNE